MVHQSLIWCNIDIYFEKVTIYKSEKPVQIWKTCGSFSKTQRWRNVFF